MVGPGAGAIVPVPMSSAAARSAAFKPLRSAGESLRVAFLGAPLWLDGCFPTAPLHGLLARRFDVAPGGDAARLLAAVSAFRPHVSVIFDPACVPADALLAAPGVTLGVLVGGDSQDGAACITGSLEALDRLVSFTPALTGARIGGAGVWRAIPPPVSDALFAEVRPLRGVPRVLSIGASSSHREAMLIDAKHHHDLLQLIHGVSGEALRELLVEYDVGVYVARAPGGGFGQQVGVHLAAGHLLIAEPLVPTHGLERDIDYLQFDSPDGLRWMLDRLRRFPEMHQRTRIRGRLKAEQFRASRLFARVLSDLLADFSAFGAVSRTEG